MIFPVHAASEAKSSETRKCNSQLLLIERFCTTAMLHGWNKGKGKVSVTGLGRPIRPALISGFRSMKRLGVFLLPPGWDACPSQGYPQHFRRYPFIHLGGERHRESKVSCPRTQHNSWNNRFFFPWEQMFFLMQNIFIVPAMQHGSRAKTLYCFKFCCNHNRKVERGFCYFPIFWSIRM